MNYVGNPPAPAGVVLVGDTNPVGMIAWFHAPPDSTWKQLNGQVLAKAAFPDLWAWAQNFLTADQAANPGLYRNVDANTFAVPKMDGLFFRAAGQFDANRVSAAVGVRQDDLIKSHQHFGGYRATDGGPNVASGGFNIGAAQSGFEKNNEFFGGPENRPTNVALLPCVKALRTVLIPGTSVPAPVAGPGQLIQSRSHIRGDNLAQAGTIPYDLTIPQITEGNEFLSVAAFAPTMIGSRLRISTHFNFSISVAGSIIGGIFRTGATDAMICTVLAPPNVDFTSALDLTTELISPSLSPITFSFRAGCNGGSGGSARMNGTSTSGTPFLGGALSSYLRVDEYSA